MRHKIKLMQQEHTLFPCAKVSTTPFSDRINISFLFRVTIIWLSFICIWLHNTQEVASQDLALWSNTMQTRKEPEKGFERIQWQVKDIYTQFLRLGKTTIRRRLNIWETAKESPIRISGDSLCLVIEFKHIISDYDLIALAQAGARIELHTTHVVQAWIPITRIKYIAAVDGVNWVRLPEIAHCDNRKPEIISQGILFIMPHFCHDEGFTGGGVKVGILDSGFDGYLSLLGSELPDYVHVKSFRSGGSLTGSEHGTACAEIVHDLAPDAELTLVAVSTEIEMTSAIEYLINQGIQVISCSMSLMIGPIDGSSYLSQKVNEAAENGVIWCNSTGNGAQKHWTGHFTDTDDDGWLNFSGGDETNTIEATIGDVISVYLDWNDWPTSTQDFNLYLWNGSLDTVLDKSFNKQDGSQPPTESILMFEAPYTGNYHIAIRRAAGSQTKRLHLRLPNTSPDLQYSVSSRSLRKPSDADGSLGIGATYWLTPWKIQPYSNQGPTDDGRVKPDLVGPDCVSTVSYGSEGFCGTSASTPHAAGVAALVLSASPCWDPEKTKDFMRSWGMDEGESGPDNIFGWGFLRARCYRNQSPVIAGPTSLSVDEGETATFDITASDPDGDPVAVKSANVPANSTLSKLYFTTWRFTFSPDYSQAGVYVVSFISSDCDLADTLVTVITVENRNRAPTITGPTSLSLNEGETTSANLGASDPDGDVVSMFAAAAPTNSTLTKIGSSTWKFEFSPDYTQAGTYSVIIIASDGSLVDTLTLAIDVSNVNRAPSIMGTASSTVKEGETTTINLAVDDPDGDALTVSAINMPDNCTILKKSSLLWECVFSPDYDQAGSYTVNFVVTDGSESDTLVWHVTVQNVNRAPQITTVNDLSGPEATTFSMTISATDFDDDLISLTAGELPENATFNDNGDGSGEFVFQPDYTQSGVYTITITASDGDLSTDVSFSVTVTNVNRPPAAFELATPSPDALLRSTSAELIWQASSDPDPDESVAHWVYINGDLPAATTDSIFANHDTNTTISDLEEQTTYRWRVVARDTSGGATENTGSWRQFSIDDLTPPTLFFGMIPNSVLPFAVDFVIKPSEELKSYATADVSIGDTATPLTFDHKIESSDGDLYSTKYNFTADGAGRIILRGRDHSNNETVDTVDFSGYRVNPSAPLYALSYDGLLAIRNSRRMGAGLALVMGYCPNTVTPFERVGWEETTAPYRFVTSERTVRGRVEIHFLSHAVENVDQNANIILFQLMRDGWMPLPTWRSSVTGDVVGYADSMGTFLAAVGPPDADLQAGMMPRKHTLYQNVPNPFNAATTISFEIAESTHSQEQLVTLVVYNVLGQKVKTLMREALPPGTHSIRWDTADDSNQPMPSGVYFARLLVGSESTTIKMVLMK